jgi:hypothetical protein
LTILQNAPLGACLLAGIHGPAEGDSVAAQIAEDMRGRNEGSPHGVPLSFDWAKGPVVVMGNNSNGERAVTAWGAVYEAAEGKAVTGRLVS